MHNIWNVQCNTLFDFASSHMKSDIECTLVVEPFFAWIGKVVTIVVASRANNIIKTVFDLGIEHQSIGH